MKTLYSWDSLDIHVYKTTVEQIYCTYIAFLEN